MITTRFNEPKATGQTPAKTNSFRERLPMSGSKSNDTKGDSDKYRSSHRKKKKITEENGKIMPTKSRARTNFVGRNDAPDSNWYKKRQQDDKRDRRKRVMASAKNPGAKTPNSRGRRSTTTCIGKEFSCSTNGDGPDPNVARQQGKGKSDNKEKEMPDCEQCNLGTQCKRHTHYHWANNKGEGKHEQGAALRIQRNKPRPVKLCHHDFGECENMACHLHRKAKQGQKGDRTHALRVAMEETMEESKDCAHDHEPVVYTSATVAHKEVRPLTTASAPSIDSEEEDEQEACRRAYQDSDDDTFYASDSETKEADVTISSSTAKPKSKEDKVLNKLFGFVTDPTKWAKPKENEMKEEDKHVHRCDECDRPYYHYHHFNSRIHKQYDHQCPNFMCSQYFGKNRDTLHNPTVSMLMTTDEVIAAANNSVPVTQSGPLPENFSTSSEEKPRKIDLEKSLRTSKSIIFLNSVDGTEKNEWRSPSQFAQDAMFWMRTHTSRVSHSHLTNEPQQLITTEAMTSRSVVKFRMPRRLKKSVAKAGTRRSLQLGSPFLPFWMRCVHTTVVKTPVTHRLQTTWTRDAPVVVKERSKPQELNLFAGIYDRCMDVIIYPALFDILTQDLELSCKVALDDNLGIRAVFKARIKAKMVDLYPREMATWHATTESESIMNNTFGVYVNHRVLCDAFAVRYGSGDKPPVDRPLLNGPKVPCSKSPNGKNPSA